MYGIYMTMTWCVFGINLVYIHIYGIQSKYNAST